MTIRATGRDSIVPGIADVAFVTMEFDSGLIANVELSWLAPSKLRRTVVVGSRKMVVYEDGGPEAVKIYDRGVDYKDPETFGEYQLSYRSGDIRSPKLSNEEPLAVQLGDFVRGMTEDRGPGRAPAPRARRGAARRGGRGLDAERRRAGGPRSERAAGRIRVNGSCEHRRPCATPGWLAAAPAVVGSGAATSRPRSAAAAVRAATPWRCCWR